MINDSTIHLASAKIDVGFSAAKKSSNFYEKKKLVNDLPWSS